MSTELVTQRASLPDAEEIKGLSILANHLAKSLMFKDAEDGYKALAKLMFGRDLGLSATAAMTGIHIVEGKPEIGSNIHATMVNTFVNQFGERYQYTVVEHTNDVCRIKFYRGDGDKAVPVDEGGALHRRVAVFDGRRGACGPPAANEVR